MIDEREDDLIVLKSLKVMNENFIKKHHFDIYNRILNYCCDEAKSYSFQHKLTWYFLGIKDFPKCEICGNINKQELKWSTHTKNMLARFCSKKCYNLYLAKLRKQTCIEKYGVTNISQLQSVKDKKKDTCLEHYGSDNPSKVQEIQNKKIQTNIERYGFKSAMHNDQIKLKLKESFIKKYGADNPMHIEEFKNKLMQTNMERFGYSWVLSDPKTIEKTRNTCREKYGVDWPTKIKTIKERISKNNKDETIDDVIFRLFYMFKKPAKNGLICLRNIKKYELFIEMTSNEEYKQKLDELIIKNKESIINNYGKLDITEKEIREINKQRGYEKVKKTSLLLYGKSNYSMTNESKQNQHIQKLKRYYLQYQNNEYSIPLFTEKEFLQSKNGDVLKWKCKKCGKEFSAEIKTNRFSFSKCDVCYEKRKSMSSYEIEFYQYFNGDDLIQCQRNIIFPKELDIYVPSKNIAIEFDGLYWHSSLFINDNNYHVSKTNMCESKNIQLFHIFEDEWVSNKEVIKKIFFGLLKPESNNKIDINDCSTNEIDSEECKDFLNSNSYFKNYGTKNISLSYQNDIKFVCCFDENNNIINFSKKLFTQFDSNPLVFLLKKLNIENCNIIVDRRFYDKSITKDFKINKILDPQCWSCSMTNRQQIPENSKEDKIWDCGYLVLNGVK